MMERGIIAGADERARAVHLAGLLAELGASALTLAEPGRATRELRTRQTDLPGAIAAAPEGSVIECRSPPVRVTISRAALAWESDDAHFIAAASAAFRT